MCEVFTSSFRFLNHTDISFYTFPVDLVLTTVINHHLNVSLDKTFVLFWGGYHTVSTVPYPVEVRNQSFLVFVFYNISGLSYLPEIETTWRCFFNQFGLSHLVDWVLVQQKTVMSKRILFLYGTLKIRPFCFHFSLKIVPHITSGHDSRCRKTGSLTHDQHKRRQEDQSRSSHGMLYICVGKTSSGVGD